jgi:hypothetical protein
LICLGFCELSTKISSGFETNGLTFSIAFPSKARQEVLPAASPLIIQPVHLFDSNLEVIYKKMPPNRSPAFFLSSEREARL